MINESAVIDSIQLYEVSIPLKVPFQISGGVSFARRSLIVVLTSEGCRGYGESAPFEEPYYSSETISSVRCLDTELLIPRMLHRKIRSIEHINEILNTGVRGNPFAKAGIENAYWDLICRKNRVTLREVIAAKLAEMGLEGSDVESAGSIPSGVSIGIPTDNSTAHLAESAAEFVRQGYRRIKIKVRPGWDLEPLRAVRKAIGKFPLWVDANASFDYEKHRDVLRAMDEYGCLFYEQPLAPDDILDHAKLAKYVRTPLCLDESLKSAAVGRQALETGAARIWNVKIQRIGGLWEGLKIYRLACRSGVALWGGTMPESGLGALPILTLASFSAFRFPADVEASEKWFGPGNDLYEIRMGRDGRIPVPECRGAEEIIDFDNLNKYGQLLAECA